MDDYVVNSTLKFLQVNIKKATEFGDFFREIIMKKKSLGFLLNKVRRSLFNNYMIQDET